MLFSIYTVVYTVITISAAAGQLGGAEGSPVGISEPAVCNLPLHYADPRHPISTLRVPLSICALSICGFSAGLHDRVHVRMRQWRTGHFYSACPRVSLCVGRRRRVPPRDFSDGEHSLCVPRAAHTRWRARAVRSHWRRAVSISPFVVVVGVGIWPSEGAADDFGERKQRLFGGVRASGCPRSGRRGLNVRADGRPQLPLCAQPTAVRCWKRRLFGAQRFCR